MSDRADPDGTTDRGDGDDAGELGRIGAKYLGVLSDWSPYPGVMPDHALRGVVLAAVLVGLVVAPLAVVAEIPATAPATANASDPAPGARFAGVVGTQDAEVRGTLAADRFEARLANANSDRERVAVIDDRLTVAEQRVDRLETRLRALDRARENGSIDGDAYLARIAALGATADQTIEAARASERVAADLPAERRASLNASERVADIETRADAIRERTSEASAAIDGTDEEIRAQPISLADVRLVAEQTIRVPDSLRGVAGSERVNLHVRRADGSTAVFGVAVEDGRVTSVTGEAFENPTLAVYTDYRVIGDVRRADDSAAVVESAVANDRVRYDGQGLGNSLKYGLVRLASLVPDSPL